MTLSFNWIFVLIAGTMILLFFVGIIIKQKSVSEQKLNFDIVTVMDSILTGSTVSERTINFVDISGLAGFELYFDCELDDGGGFDDIFAQYGITGSTASSELPMQVLFAPKTMEGTEMITWSLPYKMPYKVMDLLMVTSTSVKYYVIGGENTAFRTDLENATDGFTIEFISDVSEISSPGDLYHVRIIDLDGSTLVHSMEIPDILKDADTGVVTGILISDTLSSVNYFAKNGDVWNKLTSAGSVPIINTGYEEKDAALYGALFSSDDESYKCNMMKAFKRYYLVTQLYQEKVEEMISYYEEGPEEAQANTDCGLHLTEDASNMEDALNNLASTLTTCIEQGYDYCTELSEYAREVHTLNEALSGENCETLY
tara:strand:- start:2366 stop:3478 length:1113 start_codon:yes stop_codon:yes gene_type:complete